MNILEPILVALFFGPFSLGFASIQQTNKTPIDQNLYFKALDAAIQENVKIYGSDVIVRLNRDINEGFPTQIKSFRVQYLDQQGLVQKFKQQGEAFTVLEMWPMTNDGDKVVVNISEYSVGYRKKRLELGLQGGTKVTFRYDCGKREFAIADVHVWGV